MRTRWGVVAAAATALAVAAATPAQAREALVVNALSNSVSTIDVDAVAATGTPIGVGLSPRSVAITPDGTKAFVVSNGSDSVSVIDLGSRTTGAAPIAVGDNPDSIAITPDGSRAYVTNFSATTVSVIDTAANAVVGGPIALPGASHPNSIAILPDGSRAFVSNEDSDNVSVIDTATNNVVLTISLPASTPIALAVAPDGSRVYIIQNNKLTALDPQTGAILGTPLALGASSFGLAASPDGLLTFTTSSALNQLWVVDTATNERVAQPTPVGMEPARIAVTPDSDRVAVTNRAADTVSVVDTATRATVGQPVAVGDTPVGIAVVPNQGPTGAFTVLPGGAAGTVAFNAAASSDSDGTIARFDWDFGDGQTLANGGPVPTHTYAAPGVYTVKLTVTDNEGCSTSRTFTGQTVSCNGSAKASTQQSADVAPPGLTLAGKRKQRLGTAVSVTASSSEDGLIDASGKLLVNGGTGGKRAVKVRRFKLPLRTAVVTAGQAATLKLKLSRKAKKAATKALKSGGRVRANVQVVAHDGFANASSASETIKLSSRSLQH